MGHEWDTSGTHLQTMEQQQGDNGQWGDDRQTTGDYLEDYIMGEKGRQDRNNSNNIGRQLRNSWETRFQGSSGRHNAGDTAGGW